MDALVLVIGAAIAVVWLTAMLAWRGHSDRRLSARRGYSWGASYNDRRAAEIAASHMRNSARSVSWPQ